MVTKIKIFEKAEGFFSGIDRSVVAPIVAVGLFALGAYAVHFILQKRKSSLASKSISTGGGIGVTLEYNPSTFNPPKTTDEVFKASPTLLLKNTAEPINRSPREIFNRTFENSLRPSFQNFKMLTESVVYQDHGIRGFSEHDPSTLNQPLLLRNEPEPISIQPISIPMKQSETDSKEFLDVSSEVSDAETIETKIESKKALLDDKEQVPELDQQAEESGAEIESYPSLSEAPKKDEQILKEEFLVAIEVNNSRCLMDFQKESFLADEEFMLGAILYAETKVIGSGSAIFAKTSASLRNNRQFVLAVAKGARKLVEEGKLLTNMIDIVSNLPLNSPLKKDILFLIDLVKISGEKELFFIDPETKQIVEVVLKDYVSKLPKKTVMPHFEDEITAFYREKLKNR